MTIKSLLNWGGFKGESERPLVTNEQWHRGGWDFKSHGHSHGHHKGGGKGSGGNAVLSALALLAFLFLINVMQQSLNDNNSTATTGSTTALLIREDDSPITLNSRGDEEILKSRSSRNINHARTVDTSHPKKNPMN